MDQWQSQGLTWVATWAQVCAGPALAQPGGLRPLSGSGNSCRGWTLAGGAQYGARGNLDPWEGGSLAERLVSCGPEVGRGGQCAVPRA